MNRRDWQAARRQSKRDLLRRVRAYTNEADIRGQLWLAYVGVAELGDETMGIYTRCENDWVPM